MLSAHRSVRPQKTCITAARTQRQPTLPPSSLKSVYGRCESLPSTSPGRRSFSWRTKRVYGYFHDPSVYRSAITYAGPTLHRSNRTTYRSYFWKRGHFLNQYTQSPEWRLLSSWGRLNDASRSKDGSHNDTRKDKEAHEYDWYGEWQKRHVESLKHFEEFKKMIDEDPYGVIFGRRIPIRNEQRDNRSSSGAENGNVQEPARRPDGTGPSKTKTAGASTPSPKPTTDRNHYVDNVKVASNGGEEFVIDPITMRKIPKRSSPTQESARKENYNAQTETFNIPVKTYKMPEQTSKAAAPNSNVHPTIRKLELEGENWLAQEGFGKKPQSSNPQLQTPHKSTRIESALERHLGKERNAAAEEKEDKATLAYNPVESKMDDVDLLTASDIRASAGRASKTPKQSTKEKQDQREALESDYEKRTDELEQRLEAEISASREQSKQELMQELESIAKDVRKRDAARISHEEEVKAQKAAMEAYETGRTNHEQPKPASSSAYGIQPGEGDMALNVHEFAGRDRWYKRKAPHASREAEKQKLLQTNKDKAFVQEIRGIYEDAYGIIDTKHRQQPAAKPEEISDYPGDAYPGTLYDQPWSANVLNDHPEATSQDSVTLDDQLVSQDRHKQQSFQASSLIGKLFGELRENQALLQEYQCQLRKLPTKNKSKNLYRSLQAHEQRIMHTLKAAQALIKSTAAQSSDNPAGLPKDVVLLSKGESDIVDDAASVEQDLKSDEAPAVSSATYEILAYDPSTEQVTSTKTTTLEEPLTGKAPTFPEALSGLEHPAKFLYRLSTIKNGESEIVAGGPNILVFKKSQGVLPQTTPGDVPLDPASSAGDTPFRFANPIDGTTTQTGNFASPTGFVNYDSPYTPLEPADDPPPTPTSQAWRSKPNDKIHRQEDVFSGSSRRARQDHHEHQKAKARQKHRRSTRRRRTLKRMFLVGLFTAGGCYAVGVVSEFLRIQ